MKNIIAVLFVAASFVSFGQSYTVEVEDATVAFYYVSEKTKGSIEGIEAKININAEDLSASSISGVANVTALTTANNDRDKHLMSPDFFDAATYPVMRFESSSIKKEGDLYMAEGKLTIKDVTKDVSFRVLEKDGALKFKTEIFGADYGVAVDKGREKSKVQVVVTIPLR